MTSQLSFAPERRYLQENLYRFSYRPSIFTNDGYTYSPQDSMMFNIEKIYKEKFSGINPSTISILVNLIISDIPIGHKNLLYLAAAVYVVHLYKNQIVNQDYFDNEYNKVSEALINGINDTKKINYTTIKITLLRYIYYVSSYINKSLYDKLNKLMI